MYWVFPKYQVSLKLYMKSRQNTTKQRKIAKKLFCTVFLPHGAQLEVRCIGAVRYISCRIEHGPSVLSLEFFKLRSDCHCHRSWAWKVMLVPPRINYSSQTCIYCKFCVLFNHRIIFSSPDKYTVSFWGQILSISELHGTWTLHSVSCIYNQLQRWFWN